MSEAMPKEIVEAIAAVMHKVGYVQKKGTNTFHNYKYASIEDVLDKVQPALAEFGLIITQDELTHEIIADGNLMQATYAFGLAHKSGKVATPIRHTGLAALRNSKGGYDDKSLNKCHTAARKYFILGLFQIPTGLAADPDDDEDKPPVTRTPTVVADNPPTMAGRKNEADGIRKAREWANNAHAALAGFDTPNGLKNWLDKNSATVDKLKAVVPEEFEALEAKINATAERLNVLAAG